MFIYLIKAFDISLWAEHFPIAFHTAKEASEYCNKHTTATIIYTFERIEMGRMNGV
jgi:hypothetical protein